MIILRKPLENETIIVKVYSKINKEAKQIVNNYEIADRIDCLRKFNPFISFKDHKDNFLSNPKCRLINPTKSQIGKISKLFIENINTKVRYLSAVHQGKILMLFLIGLKKCTCMQFDIEEVYLSISMKLLQNPINYASTFGRISNEEIVVHSRKSLLFNSNNIWIKKGSDPYFDLTMGSYDGAEICELVGLYILQVLGEK